MNILNTKAGPALVLVGAAGVALYLLSRWLPKVGEAFNPVSDQNLAYRGVNAVGEAVTGDQNFSLGGFVFDLFHEPYDPNAPYKGSRQAELQRRLPSVPQSTPQILK